MTVSINNTVQLYELLVNMQGQGFVVVFAENFNNKQKGLSIQI